MNREAVVGGAWCYLPQGPEGELYRGRVEGVVSGGVAWPDKAVELLD